jgi:TrpR-related protein YerC/YecD
MSVTNRWYQKEVDELLESIVAIDNKDELASLFEKVLTPREINDCARRLKAKKMLESGASYSQVRDMVGLADAAIARISSSIGFGFRRSYSNVGSPSSKSKRRKIKVLPSYKGTPAIRL